MVAAANRPNQPALSVCGLHCGPLAELSFQVAQGESVALLGRNGAGKSSLLRAVAKLIPSRGAVVCPGTIGYAPQDYRTSLFPWLSVEHNIGMFLRGQRLPLGEPERRIRTSLEALRLRPAMLSQRPHRLSGGEQQLVCLARALAAEPALLLLDEPFSALDLAMRAMARTAVADCARRTGAAMILVSHDLDDVIGLADRALVLGGTPTGIAADLPLHEHGSPQLRAELLRACERAAP